MAESGWSAVEEHFSIVMIDAQNPHPFFFFAGARFRMLRPSSIAASGPPPRVCGMCYSRYWVVASETLCVSIWV